MIVRTLDRGDPPGKTAGMIGTVLVHAAAATFLFSQARSGPPSPPVYAVELLAAPAPAPRQRLAREAVPTPPPPEKPAPVKPQPKPAKTAPVPEPKRPAPTETQPRAAAQDPGAGHPGSRRDAEHRQRRDHHQDPGASVPLSRVSPEHREPGVSAMGPGRGAGGRLRGGQLHDPARRLGPRHSFRDPLGQLRLRPRRPGRGGGRRQLPRLRPAARWLGGRRAARKLLLQAGFP